MLQTLIHEVVDMLIAGDDPILRQLRAQVRASIRCDLELTGVGFFERFLVSDPSLRLSHRSDFVLSDIVADLHPLVNGLGFALFIQDGIISQIEGYTFDEAFPSEIAGYSLRYLGSPDRRLFDLKATPGWPEAS